jgi:hypothetical protein
MSFFLDSTNKKTVFLEKSFTMKKILLLTIACAPLLMQAQVFIGFNYTTPIAPQVVAGNDTTVKANDPFTLHGSFAGGTAPITHYWSPGQWLNDSTLLNPTAIINQNLTFTLTVSDSNVCVVTDQVNISVVPDGIETISAEQLKIFPNPNNGKFTIDGLNSIFQNVISLKLISLHGKLLYKEEINGHAGKVDVSLPQLPSGMYLVELHSDNTRLIIKLFIQ